MLSNVWLHCIFLLHNYDVSIMLQDQYQNNMNSYRLEPLANSTEMSFPSIERGGCREWRI